MDSHRESDNLGSIDWQRLYLERKSVAHQFGKIWALPLNTRYHRVLAKLGEPGVRLLEIGAGDRGLSKKMTEYWGSFSYTSCDIDTTYKHDFEHVDEVSGLFDVICAFELIEHLTLREAHLMLSRLFEHLEVGGSIALTTPNIFYPPAFLRDATHITPFCYDELGGLLQVSGFKVSQVFRLHHDSIFKKFLKRYVFYPLFRLLGIDFAKQIMVVAVKPAV